MYRYNVVPDGSINRWKIFDNQENKLLDQVFSSRHIAEARMKELNNNNGNPHRGAMRKAQVIMDVVGTPEKNREILVKALFLEMNMTCTSCNLTYATGADLEQMQIEKYFDADNPNRMTVYLTCHCGHSGQYTFKPNPFMMANVSSDAYGTGENVS